MSGQGRCHHVASEMVIVPLLTLEGKEVALDGEYNQLVSLHPQL